MYPSYQSIYGQTPPQQQQQPPPPYAALLQQHQQPPPSPASSSVSSASAAADATVAGGLEALLGQLRRMDIEELQKLLDSDDKVAEFTGASRELQQLGQDKQAAMAANRQLAESNFACGPRIEASRRSLAGLSEQADAARAAFLETRARLESLNAAASSDTLLSLLEAGCMEADEAAEAVADELAAGRADLAGFVRRYSEARQLYHLRRVKADHLARPATPP